MIRLIESGAQRPFLSFCEGDPCGVRISAFLEAYGAQQPFALFWAQTDGSGRMTAALSRIDGDMTVCASPQADLEELWAFLQAVGFESILSPEQAAPRGLPGPSWQAQRCAPMRLRQLHAPQRRGAGWALCREPALGEIYALLQTAGEALPCLSAWLPDLSHRVRHGAACVWALREGNALTACAMAVAQTEREALLGGVAVLPEKRGHGRGSYLAAALCESLCAQGRRVYLLRREGEHAPLYRRIGFAPHGKPVLMMTKEGV